MAPLRAYEGIPALLLATVITDHLERYRPTLCRESNTPRKAMTTNSADKRNLAKYRS